MRKLALFVIFILATFVIFSVSSCGLKVEKVTDEDFTPRINRNEVTFGFFRSGIIKFSNLKEKTFINIYTTSGLYGYIYISNPSPLEGEYVVFDDKGKVLYHKEGIVFYEDKSYDLDDDGFEEFSVQKDWIEFFSDESMKKFSLYSYEFSHGILYEYEDGRKVYGADPEKFRSVPVDGKLPDASGVYFLKTSELPSLKKGDVIFDVASYKYTGEIFIRTVKNIKDNSDYVYVESESKKIEEIFPLVIFRIKSELSEAEPLNDDGENSFVTKSGVKLINYDSSSTLLDKSYATVTAYYGVGLDMDIDVVLDYDWNNFYMEVTVPFELYNYLKLNLKAQDDYKKEGEKDPFYEPSFAFTVYGIPVVTSLPIYAGYTFEATGTADATIGYNLEANLTASAFMEGRLTLSGIDVDKGWDVTTSGSVERIGPEFELNGKAKLRGYIGVDIKISVASIGYSSFKNKPYLQPQVEGTLKGDPYPDALVTFSAPYGIDFSIELGYDFKAKKDDWKKHIKDWEIGKFGPWNFGLPAQPTSFRVEYRTDNEIKLAWTDNSDYEEGFVLKRYVYTGSGWSEDAEIDLPENTTYYTDSEINIDSGYRYTVQAYDDWPTGDRYESVSVSIKSYSPPRELQAAPYNDAASIKPVLSWIWRGVQNGDASFEIQLSTSPTFENVQYFSPTLTTNNGKWSFQMSESLVGETTYYWKVIGFTDDDERVESAVASFTTIPNNKKYLFIRSYEYYNPFDLTRPPIPLPGGVVFVNGVRYTTPATVLVDKGNEYEIVGVDYVPNPQIVRVTPNTLVLFKEWVYQDGTTDSSTEIIYNIDDTDEDQNLNFIADLYYRVLLSVNPEGSGEINVHTTGAFKGEYCLKGMDVKMSVSPSSGYSFSHWEVSLGDLPYTTTENPMSFSCTSPGEITAHMEESE